MSKTVQISVLMPVYNGATYLEEAIKSILSQTFRDFEFIIVNDGSTDQSEEIIMSFTDERILYIKNGKNSGIVESLNRGLEVAQGKYIARMDADDIALPERLQSQLDEFEKNPSLIAAGTDYYLLEGERLSYEKNINDSDYQKTVLMFATCFAHPTVMFKNNFKETGIRYDGNFAHAEDYRLWTELSFYGEFCNTAKPLLKYRSHPSQVSVENRSAQLAVSARIRRDYMEKLGFLFSEQQFKVHSFVGNNEVIRSMDKLLSIEAWLKELLAQNNASKKLKAASFNRAIHKFWVDSCGNTRLGYQAYRIYSKSDLSLLSEKSALQRVKLLLKCLIRRFIH